LKERKEKEKKEKERQKERERQAEMEGGPQSPTQNKKDKKSGSGGFKSIKGLVSM
jgi:septal ring factor EnvC (AmiA/AmiB activator)